MNLKTVNNLFIVCFCLIINYIEANDEISVTVFRRIKRHVLNYRILTPLSL